jgi:hypothetical protein
MMHTSDEKAFWKTRRTYVEEETVTHALAPAHPPLPSENVPLTVEDKGYHGQHSAKVPDRLVALTAAVCGSRSYTVWYPNTCTQTHKYTQIHTNTHKHTNPLLLLQQMLWLKKYDDAKTAWLTIQSGDGETFDLNVQLTPIQSRVMSLQVAEEAWKMRGDGFRSLKEADIRDNLASLTARFQSLQHTLSTSESRWKAKGTGMQQKETNPDRGARNTMDSIGGLLDRLGSLQHEQEAWVTRKNSAITRYEGKDFFSKDVKDIRGRQEEERQRKEEAREEAEAERERREEAERAEREQREQAEKAERDEAARRGVVKDKMRKASEIKNGYNPKNARDEAIAQMSAEEAAVRAKAEAEAKKKRDAEEKARKEEELKKEKASKANKFFS